MSAAPFGLLLHLLLPEVVLTLTALVVLAADLALLSRRSLRTRFAAGAALACCGFGFALFVVLTAPVGLSLPDGMLTATPLSRLLQAMLLILSMLVVLLSIRSGFTAHVGEYLLLLLLGAAGMLLLVSSENLLLIFLALELLSLSLYVLTAFDKRSLRSAEAGLKYYLFGGVSTAFLLFAFSLIYGMTGSLWLREIAHSIAAAAPGTAMDPLLALAIVMVVVGLGFKIAAAPFHLWAPDAYEGAPAPSAAFIASASKVAGVAVLLRVLGNLAPPAWSPLLAWMAVASMLFGNLAALVQKDVRRLLAYSAVAHAGYLLIGFVSGTPQSTAALLYYIFTYALALAGAFGVIAAVERNAGDSLLSDYAGLGRRAPLPAFCLLICVLSIAGIPPLAGFFGKFYLFMAVLHGPHGESLLWLVAFALGASTFSLYYYLRLLKQVYVAPAAEGAPLLRIPALMQMVLAFIAAGVFLLGAFPALLLAWIEHAVAASQ